MEKIAYDTDVQEDELVQIIKYFGVFHYPLRLEEIYNFSGQTCSLYVLQERLAALAEATDIHCFHDFYYWGDDKSCICKRLKGEQEAIRILPRAFSIGRFISLFPFVKFVGISGSLSKGYAHKNADFDYFIITANNTLWVCRTLLHLFKKLTFLTGMQHWFCMNYFIDRNHLDIEEKNLFTRVELMTLIPVKNTNEYKYLLLKNKLPNIEKQPLNVPKDSFTAAYEHIYRKEQNTWLKPLNLFLMKITDRKWQKKWQRMNFPEEDYALCFKTTPYVSKNHPKNYQKITLEKFTQH